MVLLLLAAHSSAQAAIQRSIRVVMDNNYPPFAFNGAGRELHGIAVDEWRLWELRTGIHVEIHGMDWGEALRRMKAGEFDVIDTIFKTPEREAYLDFTQPYARIEVPIFFRKEISGIIGLKSLEGFVVGAKAGDSAEDLLRKNSRATVVTFKNYEEMITAAKEHKINVFVMDEPAAHYFLYKHGIQDQFRQSPPLNVGQFHRAVRKGNLALLKTVEDGFASLKPSELKRIEEKWYGKSVPHPNLRYLGYAALTGLLLVLGLGAWNIALKRLVRLRTAAFQRTQASLEDAQMVGRMGNWELDPATGIGFWSKEMFRLFDRDPTLGVPLLSEFLELVHPDDRDVLMRTQNRVIETKKMEVQVFRTHPARGPIRFFETTLAARLGRNGKLLYVGGTVLDITDRKRVENELRRTNRTLRMISECNQALVRATGEAQLLKAICSLLVESGGYRMAWVGFAEQDQARSVRVAAQAGFEAGYLDAANITWADEERGRGPTGTAIRTAKPVIARNILTDPAFGPWRKAAIERGYASSAALPLKIQQGVMGALMVYASDPEAFETAEVELLTELADDLAYGIAALRIRSENERVQEQLHRLSARLLQVRDAERRHLARELHDTTAQHLAALTLALTSLKANLPDASQRAQAFCQDCMQLAQQAAQEIRTHSYLLHPPLLEAMGLVGAVEDYVQGFSARSGIAVKLKGTHEFGRLGDEEELALFRVVQECLANVLKHSRSTQARIRFTRGPDFATLEVEDTGVGIPSEKLGRIQHQAGGSGVGLGGMQERLRLLGGLLMIESTETGTTIRATVPVGAVARH